MPARPPSLRLPAPAVALALLLTAGAAAQGPDAAAQAMATTPADAPAASPVGEPGTEPDPAGPPATAADEAPRLDSTVADESAAAEAGESDDDKEAPALAAPDASKRKLLEERLAGLDASGLADAEKQKAAEFYRRALASFDVATQQIEAARQFDAQLAEIQNGKDSKGKRSTAWYAARLAAPLPPYAETDGLSVEQVEKWAENCETNLAYYRGELAAMVAEPKRRSQRLAEAPKQIAAAEQTLKETSEKLAALGSEDAADLVAAAERQALELAEIECRATLLALQSEQRLYEKTGEWVTTRRDYYARYVPHKEKRLAQLREIINHLREQEAQSQARLATAAAEAVEATRPKQILELANDNKLLADERVAVAAAMNGVVKSFDATRATLSVLTDQYDRAERQAKELSNAGGQLLREQQAKLPNLHDLERSYGEREPLLSEVLIRSFELNDQSSELANLDERTDQLAAQAGDLSAASRAEVRMLLEAKRDTLKSLIDDYTEYSSKLNLLHTEEAKLIALTEEYADFIAERVLWIRSCKPPAAADLAHAVHAAAWSLDPHNWRDAGQGVMATIQRRPLQFAAWTLMLAALIGVQGPARRHLRQCGAEAKKRSCTRLRPTVQALGLTALVALPWPAALAFVGWSIDSQSELEFVRALGAGARFIAVCLLLLELARHLCRQNGIADAHFDWPHACLVHVRRKLRWLTTLGLPLTLWLVALEVQAEEPYWSSSLGRAQFIGVMLLLAAVWHRTLLAAHSPFRQISLIGRGGWLTPLEVIWRPAVVLLPVSLALLAVVGYYYTAGQAAVRILQTVGLLLAVLTLGGLTRRWLLVSRRRLAREQAKLRRVQLAAASDDDPAAPLPSDLVDEAVDRAALSEQTQKLVRTFLSITLAVGLVLIWGEILPALKYPA
ncbi:MAG TPA: hypothetical protein VEQ85_05720, partial [Lacipirellulaceae bacterium]|nr:hypothetical protein [Lacipirellulaceae bacterium]